MEAVEQHFTVGDAQKVGSVSQSCDLRGTNTVAPLMDDHPSIHSDLFIVPEERGSEPTVGVTQSELAGREMSFRGDREEGDLM